MRAAPTQPVFAASPHVKIKSKLINFSGFTPVLPRAEFSPLLQQEPSLQMRAESGPVKLAKLKSLL